MTKTNKKFMALAAVAALGVAGAAWAVTTTTFVGTDGTNYNLAATDTPVAGIVGFGLSQDVIMTGTSATATGNIQFASSGPNWTTVRVGDNQVLTFAPAAGRIISGDNTQIVHKAGTGEWVLAPANGGNPAAGTHSTLGVNAGGAVVSVDQGILTLQHSNSLGYASLALSGDSTLRVRKGDVSLGYQAPNAMSLAAQILRVTNETTTARPVNFDVETLSTDLVLRLYQGISQDVFTGPITVNKINTGKMIIDKPGSRHTGGTTLRAGTLEMFSDSTARYGAALGQTYVVSPDETVVPYTPGTVLQTPVAGTWAYNNYFRSEAGSTFITNVDQYFGAFDGAGTIIGKIKNGTVKPIITAWLNTDSRATNSTYTGSITGDMHLYLDASRSDDVRLQTLRLEGTNRWNGETWVVDGILSAKDVNSIGTDMIRVGLNGANNSPATNGLADNRYLTNGRATLHFTADSVIPNKTVTETGAGLGVDDRAMTTYNDIAVYSDMAINPWLNATNTAPQNYLGTVRWDSKIKYAGTITAPTNINVERGRLQLWANPAAAGDFARIYVKENARLGFGPAVQNMLTVYDVSVDQAAALEGYVTPNNVKLTKNFTDLYNDAIMRFNGFNADALGRNITDANKYLKIKLTLANSMTIKKGSYIPLVSARNFIGQPALYDVPTDTHKVRAYIDNLDNNNLESAYLKVDTKTYDGVIYAEVIRDIAPATSGDVSPDPTPQPSGSSSSGCSTGAFASFAALLLAPLALLRKKD